MYVIAACRVYPCHEFEAYTVSQEYNDAMVQLDSIAISELALLTGLPADTLDLTEPDALEDGYNLIEFGDAPGLRNAADDCEQLALVYYSESTKTYRVEKLFRLCRLERSVDERLRESAAEFEAEFDQSEPPRD